MNKFVKLTYHQLRFLTKIGFSAYVKYSLASSGSELKVTIADNPVTIRKGTPDLKVAVSCLTGEFEILRYLLPKDYKGVIVDAGGYIGTSAIALHKMFPLANIVVVEPSQDNLNVLKKNVKSIENIKVVYGALVGRDQKSISLKNRGTGEWGFSVVENPKDTPSAEFLQETPAFKLADLVDDGAEIGLLKLDIEGGEVDLMTEDMLSLQKIPVVFAELHDRIIDGCEELFFKFSENRILIKDKGEKFLSISR